MIEKLKRQNARLKEEFIELKDKLQSFQSKMKVTEPILEWQGKEEPYSQKDETDKLIEHYKKQIGILKAHLQSSFDLDRFLILFIHRITSLENEEKEKRSLLEKLKEEEETLIKGQAVYEYKENKNDMNEQLAKEIKSRKEELKEKQKILKKKDKYLKVQNNKLVTLEEQASRIESLIAKHKADPLDVNKKEEDLEILKEQLKQAENEYNEQKKKYRKIILTEKAQIKDMNFELEKLTLIIKQKNYENRMNNIRINELKNQLRANKRSRAKLVCAKKKISIDPKLMALNINRLKEDIKAEEENTKNNSMNADIQDIVFNRKLLY